ncbi:MAG: Fur family transcriptional regulator [Acidobacteriaceae bacterium]
MHQGEPVSFAEMCQRHGLAVTHQRQVLYEVMQGMHGHPSPEEVYLRVRKRIPSISLATVYKNIHLFIQSGVLREVSQHHGPLHLEMNAHPHHHFVCTVCKSITDVDEKALGLEVREKKLPKGALIERYSVDILGRCAQCQKL